MNCHLGEHILTVGPDPGVRDLIATVAARSSGTRVAYADTGAFALRLDRSEPQHVVLADVRLPDMDGLDFARDILARRHRPVILFGAAPTVAVTLSALRAGVADYLPTPLDPRELLKTLTRCAVRDVAARREIRHQQKMRALLRRVLRDRRHLNQRIDLICRDMVGAQRRLFHRILNIEDPSSLTR